MLPGEDGYSILEKLKKDETTRDIPIIMVTAKDAEYDNSFKPAYNIRYFNITKWVTDKRENSIEKLINVYKVLSDEDCNIALVFHRRMEKTEVYLAVVNTGNASDNVTVDNFRIRIAEAIRGNFPGSEWTDKDCVGVIPCLNNSFPYSVASASNIPGEKSEKFISQTIEKLLDGIIPDSPSREYTLILLATPIRDIEERKLHLEELYTALAPYAGWQTSFTYTESDSTNAMATFGLNAGVSAGLQSSGTISQANTQGTTDSTGTTTTDSTSDSTSDAKGVSETDSTSSSTSYSEGESSIIGSSTTSSTGTSHGIGENLSEEGYKQKDIQGTFYVVDHGLEINNLVNEPEACTFSDGNITGDSDGSVYVPFVVRNGFIVPGI